MSEHRQITTSPLHHMNTLCVILARAGSKGLRSKNVIDLLGRPLIEYTIDHTLAADVPMTVALSTDDPQAAAIGRRRGLEVIERPAELASDTATVDSAARHAVEVIESRRGMTFNAVVICYGNIPLRPDDLIDRALDKLAATGCDSVQSVYPVGKNHPLWMRRLVGEQGDVIEAYQPNNIYRRQDLPPVFMLNGGIIAVRRDSLFRVVDGEPHAFLGDDRRGIVTAPEDVVDVDTALDLTIARAVIEHRAGGSGREAMTIAGRRIGRGEPTYVIAEIGVNHDGSVERAMELVRAARDAEADAVKLQLFDADRLLSEQAVLAAYQKSSASDPRAMLQQLQLGVEDMQRVRSLCRELGLACIVTCFSVELTEAMRALDVDAVKIASPDAVNKPLIDAMRALGKPLLISTGTCTMDELHRTMRWCADDELALLHCVSAYPTPLDQANLGRITALASLFARPAGYSDHTAEPTAGVIAAARGAVLIEKHLTYDTKAAGPDHAASFDPDQFTRYVQHIRTAEIMLAGDAYDTQAAEADVRHVSRQSVCAARDLPAGHVLTRDDLTVKRPGDGIPAADLDTLIGRRVSRPIPANHLLRAEDIEKSASRKGAKAQRRDVA